MLRTADFDFSLPDELIALRPTERRDGSRMLVVHRGEGRIEHQAFSDFASFVQPDDLVVLNDVRVARARFFADEGRIEILRLEMFTPVLWRCMVKPGRRMRLGQRVHIGSVAGVVEAINEDGTRLIAWDDIIDENVQGHLALPPYIRREDDETDDERYQTVYARRDRCDAIAAPTAGLHFTDEILSGLRNTAITLHVGAGTFQPVRAERPVDHVMHRERYEITSGAATMIEAASRRIAVGTTVARVLEHSAREFGSVTAHSGETDIFIYPPWHFQCLNVLLTNFHLPKSTLFMLVCAFGGTELLQRAYAEAVRERYRFYSYGDCMLII